MCDALDGENWKTNNDWMSSENVYLWKGVTCEGGAITNLELPSKKMESKFHIFKLLKELPWLKKLTIRNNDLEMIMEENSHTSNLEILNINSMDLEET